MSAVIEFDGVTRWFDRTPVLSGLSFRVNRGEAYALLGRNGAGKSTALRILLGFLDAHAGRAHILGEDGATLSPAARERIGYVAEGHQVFSAMRVSWLLELEDSTRERFDRAFAEKALRRFGLRTDVSVQKLSKGQQATVALVLATAGEPEVLVFDDPAMGLDVVARRELLDMLIELIAEKYGDRFEPPASLVAVAEAGGTFPAA